MADSISIDGSAVSVPSPGQTNWARVLNSALDSIAERLTNTAPVLNLTNFGIVDSDSLDQTDRLRAVFDEAADLGGATIVAPPGYTVCVSDNIRIKSDNTRFIGPGGGLFTLKILDVWTNAESYDGAFGGSVVAGMLDLFHGSGAASTLRNIEISGIKFVGTADDTVAAGDPKAIAVNSKTSRVLIRDCEFRNFGHEVIWPALTNTSHDDWTIERNRIENDDKDSVGIGAAIRGNFDNSRIIANTVIRGYTGIGLSGNNCQAIGNRLEDCILSGIGMGDGGGKSCVISGNDIYVKNDRNISNMCGIGCDGDCEDSTVVGNTIRVKNFSGGAAAARAVYLSPTAGVHTIQSNVITLDMDSLSKNLIGIAGEMTTGSAQFVLAGNQVRLKNENTTSGRQGISFTTIGGGAMQVMLGTNMVVGYTRTNNGFAIDCNDNSGGTVIVHNAASVCTGGSQRLGGVFLNDAQYDNIPVIFSSEGNVVLDPT